LEIDTEGRNPETIADEIVQRLELSAASEDTP
jgi:hypothetical protein